MNSIVKFCWEAIGEQASVVSSLVAGDSARAYSSVPATRP